jgi:ubiquinone/menaquinone biosynthesis C-methylase UbiE
MYNSASHTFYNDRQTAERYELRQGFAPAHKERMLDVVLDLLLTLAPPGASLLELGAGTGHFTRRVLAAGHFGPIHVTDGAAAMLEVARGKLGGTDNSLCFEIVDFAGEWAGRFASRRFDAVTSTMALHHARDKARLFGQICQVLMPGGLLVLGDHMAASSDLGNYLIGRERALVALGPEARTDTERIQELIERDRRRGEVEGNHCESVPRYLAALASSGFVEIDCLWQDYWLAVLIARKPGPG